MKSCIRVAIIEDDEVLRNGYQFLINASDELVTTNVYSSFDKAVKTIQTESPDVILLDIDLPGTNGIDAIPKLKKLLPRTHILMLTVYDSENLVFDALCKGASGYLIKSTSSNILISSIREVCDGGGPMSASIARMVIKSFQKNLDSPLSKRESQILELIALGKNRNHIAQALFIEPGTVKTHIRNIYNRLEVNSKEQALEVARSKRLI